MGKEWDGTRVWVTKARYLPFYLYTTSYHVEAADSGRVSTRKRSPRRGGGRCYTYIGQEMFVGRYWLPRQQWLEYDRDREAGDEREKATAPMEMWWLLNW